MEPNPTLLRLFRCFPYQIMFSQNDLCKSQGFTNWISSFHDFYFYGLALVRQYLKAVFNTIAIAIAIVIIVVVTSTPCERGSQCTSSSTCWRTVPVQVEWKSPLVSRLKKCLKYHSHSNTTYIYIYIYPLGNYEILTIHIKQLIPSPQDFVPAFLETVVGGAQHQHQRCQGVPISFIFFAFDGYLRKIATENIHKTNRFDTTTSTLRGGQWLGHLPRAWWISL